MINYAKMKFNKISTFLVPPFLSRETSVFRGTQFGKSYTTPKRTARLCGPPSLLSKVALPPSVKRPRREGGHSPLLRSKVTNEWSHTSMPAYFFMAYKGTNSSFTFSHITWTKSAPLPVSKYNLLKKRKTVKHSRCRPGRAHRFPRS